MAGLGIVVAATTALSVSANAKSSDQVTGTYQYIQGKGMLSIAARGSATGLNVTLLVGGMPIINDQPIPFTGTAGALSINDHTFGGAMIAGGRVELFFRNTTAGALTVDSVLTFVPTGR